MSGVSYPSFCRSTSDILGILKLYSVLVSENPDIIIATPSRVLSALQAKVYYIPTSHTFFAL